MLQLYNNPFGLFCQYNLKKYSDIILYYFIYKILHKLSVVANRENLLVFAGGGLRQAVFGHCLPLVYQWSGNNILFAVCFKQLKILKYAILNIENFK